MSQGKKAPPGQETRQLSIRWTPELWVALKKHADVQGLPVAEAVRRLVAAGLVQPHERYGETG